MKKHYTSITLALALASTGCNTTTPQETAQRSVQAVISSTDVALQSWGVYVVIQENIINALPDQASKDKAIKSLQDKRAKVDALQRKYSSLASTSLSLSETDYNKLDTATLVSIGSEILLTVVQFTGTTK